MIHWSDDQRLQEPLPAPVTPPSPIRPVDKKTAYEVFGKYMWDEPHQPRCRLQTVALNTEGEQPLLTKRSICDLRRRTQSHSSSPCTHQKHEIPSSPQTPSPSVLSKGAPASKPGVAVGHQRSPSPFSSNRAGPRRLWTPTSLSDHTRTKA